MSFKIGDIVKAKISHIVDFGAFVEFDGHSGLVYYTEIPNARHGDISSVLAIGDVVEAKIIDKKSVNKVSLSISKAEKIKRLNSVKDDVVQLNKEETNIRGIWKIFTEVNKYMLQFLKLPIALNASSATIDLAKSRLSIEVNTESKFKLFSQEVKSVFGTEIIEYKKDKWYLIANVDHIPESRRVKFEEESAFFYMIFHPLPVVEGRIYQFNRKDRESIQKRLEDFFPNILFIPTKGNELSFSQTYSKHFQAKEIFELLTDALDEMQEGSSLEGEEKLEPLSFKYQLNELSENGDKFLIEKNLAGQIENEETIIGALRGEEFIYRDVLIGKLSKVKYPKITITIPSEQIEAVKKLVENKELSSISSDLSGATEKINRLNESFTKITSQPEKLANPMLASYLFDASKARPLDAREIAERVSVITNNQLNSSLNEPQIEAIAKAVEAQDFSLIQGPPGTGKSTAIAELVWQLVLADRKADILLTSEANLAVDNALDRLKNSKHNLVKPIRIGTGDKISIEGLPYSITELKKWAKLELNYAEIKDDKSITSSDEYSAFNKDNVVLNQWMNNIYKRSLIKNSETRKLWFEYLNNLPDNVRKNVFDLYVRNCNLVGATCSSISEQNYRKSEEKKKLVESTFFKKYQSIFPKKDRISFKTVIQDEASKATPAELSLPLIYGKKAVVIGDHRQLPPNLDQEDILHKLHLQGLISTDYEEKAQIGKLEKFVKYNFLELEKSHFERLYMQIDPSLKGSFHYQYRMHPDINEVIKQFYKKDGGLECGFIGEPYERLGSDWFTRYHGLNVDGLISPENHVIWLDVKSPEFMDGSSRANQGEVDAIQWLLTSLAQSDSFLEYNKQFTNDEDKEIGVISFYASQLNLLRNSLTSVRDRLNIKLSSVDRFQGMERNIIIVSLVRSNKIAAYKNQSPDFRIYGELGYPPQTSLGFAKSPNRLNVALSRAKRLLIIVGNSDHYSAYRNKNGEAIYRNVFESIKNNAQGRIIPWESEFEKKKPRTMAKNRSVNLNTRDIKESETNLRHIATWLNGSANKIENPKIAVLELSTKAVKLLIGREPSVIKEMIRFDFKVFHRETFKTETGKGLGRQNMMDMDYFNRNVIPKIRRLKQTMQREGVDVVYSVATAAYRAANNREIIIEEIRNKLGLNVRILSKKEESVSTLFAYFISTKYKAELSSSPNVIMIDQGGGSTEVSVFKGNNLINSYSINLGTTALRNVLFKEFEPEISMNEALRRSDQMIKDRLITFYKNMADQIPSGEKSFCISVGTAITRATNKKNNASQHDTVLTRSFIEDRIKIAEIKIFESFPTIGELMDYDFETINSNDRIDAEVTVRLGLPMYLSLMSKFNISEIHISGTGLWYGIYLQHLFNTED